jgi:hypothetical protein
VKSKLCLVFICHNVLSSFSSRLTSFRVFVFDQNMVAVIIHCQLALSFIVSRSIRKVPKTIYVIVQVLYT